MKRILVRLLVSPALLALGGCAVGYNTALFTTKTNIGVDVDTTPPTAEVSVARREIVIAPTFEGGQTPPVIASFRYDAEGIAFFKNASSTFAGGDSAVILGKLYTSATPTTAPDNDINSCDYKSALRLEKEPTRTIPLIGRTIKLNKRGTMQAFAFGTDTMFGLKLAWSGQTAQYPDTVKVGYHRKELAVAPLSWTPDTSGPGGTVGIPSFFASSETDLNVATTTGSTVGRQQYFATGKAANYLVLQQAVRRPLAARIDAESKRYDKAAQDMIIEENKNIDSIATYVGKPDGTVDVDKLNSLASKAKLPEDWAQDYKNQPLTKLRGDLATLYSNSVSALAAAIPQQ